MTEITLPLWQVFSIGITVVLAFIGFAAGAWKVISKIQASQVQSSLAALTKSVDEIKRDMAAAVERAEAQAAEAKAKADEVEKNLLRLLAELPLAYVRREDWVRGQTVIEAKLDALAAKFDACKERNNVC